LCVSQQAAVVPAGVIRQLEGHGGGGGGGGFVDCVLHVSNLPQNAWLTTPFPIFFSV
jgi:hypothetical protein